MPGNIHREGHRILLTVFFVLLLINIFTIVFISSTLFIYILILASILVLTFLLRFFRVPERKINEEQGIISAPADGKVVAIEEVFEKDYFNEKRIQVSIFMSVWNVHINWYPVSGIVSHFSYHQGKHLIARHPKSSSMNESTTTILKVQEGKEILIRQIAGYVARRISCYSKKNKTVIAGEELGFIKFGSRVDLLLPADSKIKVNIGNKVKGKTDTLALLK